MERFGDYDRARPRKERPVEVGAMRWYVLEARHKATRVDEDNVHHSFGVELLLTPHPTAEAVEPRYVRLSMEGYTSYSDRHDDLSRTVTYALGGGPSARLSEDAYYQKYGGRSRHEAGDAAPLLAYLNDELGYDATAQDLDAVLAGLSRFTY